MTYRSIDPNGGIAGVVLFVVAIIALVWLFASCGA